MKESSLRFGRENNNRLLVRLICYVLLGIGLMILDSRFSAVQYLRQISATVLYPMQWIANQPVRLYQYADNLIQTQTDLLAQNRQLLEENGRLKIHLQQDKVNLSELTELKKLYALQQAGVSVLTGAEVISNGKDPLSDKLIINKGSQDGLKSNDAVIDQNGLIGQVTQVQAYSAEVTLLSSNQSIVPVMVARTGERSLLHGNGTKLDLRYFPTSSDLKPHDVLLTSGLDSVYPAGIPVAKLDEVVRASGTPYYLTSLSPFAGLRGSRFVLVLSQQTNKAPKN